MCSNFPCHRRYGIEIKDFGKSWRDGVAFNAIVHTIRPDLVDMDQVKRQSARINLENAFSTAENHLGIARLLDPEGTITHWTSAVKIMKQMFCFWL